MSSEISASLGSPRVVNGTGVAAVGDSSVRSRTPSQARIPSGKSKRAARREAALHSSTHSGSDANSSSAPPTSSIVQQVKNKQKKKYRKNMTSTQAEGQTSNSTSSIPSHTEQGFTDWLRSSFMAWASDATAKQQEHQEQLQRPASGNSSSSRRSRRHRHQEDSDSEEEASFESDGNETDKEVEQQHQQQLQHPFFQLARHSVPNAYGSGEEDLESHRSTSQRVPCTYAQYGCETLVNVSTADSHYQVAAAHHLQLLEAKHSVISAQKAQQTIAIEQYARALDVTQRKLAAKEKKYAKLKLAFEKKRSALQQSKQCADLSDLITSYVIGEDEAAKQRKIDSLTSQLARANTKLAEQESLLREFAAYLNPSEHQLQQANNAQQSAKASNKKKKQQPSQQQAEQSISPEVPAPTSASVFVGSPSLGASLGNPASIPHVPLVATGYKHQQRPPQPKLSRAAQAFQQSLIAPPNAKSSPVAPIQREPVQHFSVPHSALKSVAPFFNTATLKAMITATPPANQQRAATQPSESTAASVEPGQSRGAQLGLQEYCPRDFLKKMNTLFKRQAKVTNTQSNSQEGK